MIKYNTFVLIIKGQTAIHLAAQNRHANIVQLLLKKGSLFYNCYDGNTAFHAAASSGSEECIEIMFGIEKDLLNASNKDGVIIN